MSRHKPDPLHAFLQAKPRETLASYLAKQFVHKPGFTDLQRAVNNRRRDQPDSMWAQINVMDMRVDRLGLTGWLEMSFLMFSLDL